MTIQTECRNDSYESLVASGFLTDLRARCLYWFRNLGEATTQEVAEKLGKNPSDITQAVITLRQERLILTSGKRPNPKSGKQNTTYRIAQ